MNRYNNSSIYKIVSNVTQDVYYGSTCKKLSARLAEHRRTYKRYLNGTYNYVTSFKVLETGSYNIILVQSCNFETKEQLIAAERYYIDNFECVNKNIPGRTNNEYYQQNKETIQEHMKQYYQQNKEQKKEYYQQNKEQLTEKFECECGGRYTTIHKSRHMKTTMHTNYIQSLPK